MQPWRFKSVDAAYAIEINRDFLGNIDNRTTILQLSLSDRNYFLGRYFCRICLNNLSYCGKLHSTSLSLYGFIASLCGIEGINNST